MSDKNQLDWSEIETDLGEKSPALDRVRRVVTLFDDFNSHEPVQPESDFHWRHLEVYEVIGRGSFGSVHRAYDRQLRRYVALKMLPAGSTETRTWLDEARRLARVRHPNVIGIHGAETEGDYGGIWMDLVEGVSLDQLLEDGPLATAPAHEVVTSLASALVAVHDAGLVHGDVKGGNVIVEPSGRVILLDFGAAVDLREGDQLTAASPLSAAPETLEGHPASPASDVYSLGVLLYRCLVGQYPFPADTLEQLDRARRQAPPLEAIPPDYRALLRMMLATDPDHRPDASEVVARLQDILQAPEQRRRRRSLVLAFAGLAAVIVATAAGWYVSDQARQTSEMAANRSRASMSFLQDVIGASFQRGRGNDVRVMDVLEEAELRLADDTDEYVRAMVEYTVGGAYVRTSRRDDGLALLESSLASLKGMDMPVNAETGMAAVQLGIFQCQGSPERALEYAEQAFAAVQNLPPTHSANRGAHKIMACIARTRGDLKEGERWLRRALEIWPASEKTRDPDNWATLVRLGENLRRQGQVNQARDMLQQAHDGLIALVGEGHAVTSMASHALATTLIELSEYEPAAGVLERKLAADEQDSGVQSRSWIATANSLSVVLSKLGQHERAIQLNLQVIERATALYAADHPVTLVARSGLGIRYQQAGRLAEAEAAISDSHAATMDKLGQGHRMTLMNGSNLAEVILLRGRMDDAEALARSTATAASENLGEESAVTAGARAILARALWSRGEPDEAERQFRLAIESDRAGGRSSLMALETQVYFCDMLAQQGRDDEARAELEPLRATIEEKLGRDHPLSAKVVEIAERIDN